MNLKDILLEKARKSALAHFYIVEGPGPSQRRAPFDFVHDFIKSYYQTIEGHKQGLTTLQDHPDVLVLDYFGDDTKKESASYTVAEAETLERFLQFRAVQSKRKFIVIAEAHRMSVVVSNKWLKLFEEPTGETTIFLLNPRGIKLLETIHSRAIHLKLPRALENADLTDWKDFLKESKALSLAQFIDTYSRGEYRLDHIIEDMLTWESEQLSDMIAKSALEKWLKAQQEMDTFHQPTATRWAHLYSHLKEHVFRRLTD